MRGPRPEPCPRPGSDSGHTATTQPLRENGQQPLGPPAAAWRDCGGLRPGRSHVSQGDWGSSAAPGALWWRQESSVPRACAVLPLTAQSPVDPTRRWLSSPRDRPLQTAATCPLSPGRLQSWREAEAEHFPRPPGAVTTREPQQATALSGAGRIPGRGLLSARWLCCCPGASCGHQRGRAPGPCAQGFCGDFVTRLDSDSWPRH